MSSLLDKLYMAAPPLVQSSMISLYGLKVRSSEYGSEFLRLMVQFDKQQWFSEAEMKEFQSERLRSLVAHCWENVPYYRQAFQKSGVRPEDIRSTDDLHKIPILTKELIKECFEDLRARNTNPSTLTSGFTSGTSGSPLALRYDLGVRVAKNAADWRQKRWAGLEYGDKLAIFWGRVLFKGTRNRSPFWRSNWVANHMYFSTYHLSSNTIEAYLEQLDKFCPKAIEGYPSTIAIIAQYLCSRGRTLPMQAVFTSSETLFDHQREVIEKAFECPLFDYYGMAERTVFATECDHHQGMHLNPDFGISEILDDQNNQVAEGVTGTLVATGLYNYGMPLLRYRTNDVTAFNRQPCPCSRAFVRISGTMSRSEDIITTKDGRYLSFASVTLPFKTIPNILEAQVIQESRDLLRLKVVRGPSYSEADSDQLRREFIQRIGADTEIVIEFVDSIPRTKSGKFRFVISKVPLQI